MLTTPESVIDMLIFIARFLELVYKVYMLLKVSVSLMHLLARKAKHTLGVRKIP